MPQLEVESQNVGRHDPQRLFEEFLPRFVPVADDKLAVVRHEPESHEIREAATGRLRPGSDRTTDLAREYIRSEGGKGVARMSDRTTGERPPGSPNQRALGAMESAVRRARARAGVVTMPGTVQEDTQPTPLSADDDPPTPPRPSSLPAPPWGGPPATVRRKGDGSARREHWLGLSVAVAAALVVAASIALAVAAGGGGPQVAAPPAATSTTGAHASTAPVAQHATHRPGAQTHGAGAGGSGTTTSTTTVTPGGPPVIASLSPARGAAGQGILVQGANFLSSNGQILATFNGQVAPTNCPAENTCTVTVPPMGGSPSAQVVITTANGASNAVTFTYS